MTLASLVEKETGVDTERPAGRLGVPQPAAQAHAAADRPVGDLWASRSGTGKLDRDLTHRRPQGQDALQHLPDRRPAAGADRQSGRRCARRPWPIRPRPTTSISSPRPPTRRTATTSRRPTPSTSKNVALYRKAVAADEAEQAKEALEAEQAKDAGDTDANKRVYRPAHGQRRSHSMTGYARAHGARARHRLFASRSSRSTPAASISACG